MISLWSSTSLKIGCWTSIIFFYTLFLLPKYSCPLLVIYLQSRVTFKQHKLFCLFPMLNIVCAFYHRYNKIPNPYNTVRIKIIWLLAILYNLLSFSYWLDLQKPIDMIPFSEYDKPRASQYPLECKISLHSRFHLIFSFRSLLKFLLKNLYYHFKYNVLCLTHFYLSCSLHYSNIFMWLVVFFFPL